MKLERQGTVLQRSLFVLLNDPEKDIKVLSMVRFCGFNEPKKVNDHGLSSMVLFRS